MKALKILFTTMFITLMTFVQAQDTIYNRNGSIIAAKISEVTSTTISYKKLNNLEGPIYTVNKNTISFIEYKNGSKDVFADVQDSSKIVSQTAPDDVYQQPQTTTNVVIAPSVGYGWFWGWPRYRSYYRPYNRGYYRGYSNYNSFRGGRGYYGGHHGGHYGHH